MKRISFSNTPVPPSSKPPHSSDKPYGFHPEEFREFLHTIFDEIEDGKYIYDGNCFVQLQYHFKNLVYRLAFVVASSMNVGEVIDRDHFDEKYDTLILALEASTIENRDKRVLPTPYRLENLFYKTELAKVYEVFARVKDSVEYFKYLVVHLYRNYLSNYNEMTTDVVTYIQENNGCFDSEDYLRIENIPQASTMCGLLEPFAQEGLLPAFDLAHDEFDQDVFYNHVYAHFLKTIYSDVFPNVDSADFEDSHQRQSFDFTLKSYAYMESLIGMYTQASDQEKQKYVKILLALASRAITLGQYDDIIVIADHHQYLSQAALNEQSLHYNTFVHDILSVILKTDGNCFDCSSNTSSLKERMKIVDVSFIGEVLLPFYKMTNDQSGEFDPDDFIARSQEYYVAIFYTDDACMVERKYLTSFLQKYFNANETHKKHYLQLVFGCVCDIIRAKRNNHYVVLDV